LGQILCPAPRKENPTLAELKPQILPFQLRRSALWRKRQEDGYLVEYLQGKSQSWVPLAFFAHLSQAQSFVRDMTNKANREGGLKQMRIEPCPTFRRW
jgi:hypothetical protein